MDILDQKDSQQETNSKELAVNVINENSLAESNEIIEKNENYNLLSE